MASRSRKSGGRSFLPQILTTLIVGIFIIGFLGIPARPDAENVWAQLKSKSENLSNYLNGCVPGILELDFSGCAFSNFNNGGSGGGGNPSGPSKPGEGGLVLSETQKKLENIVTPTQLFFNYNRDDYKHWGNAGSSCWNVREEVLFLQAESIVLLDKNKEVTTEKKNACSIQEGVWKDPYSGETFTDPTKLDIDHIVPLSYANEVGAEPWATRLKTQFANDIERNLIAVSASQNRSKGNKGPASWLPSDSSSHCLYATKWVDVADEYKLPLKAEDITTLQNIIKTC